MNGEEILLQADKIIKRILDILTLQIKELHSRGLPLQKNIDIKLGVVYKSGLYIPLSSVEHRILVDYYETTFTEQYIEMFKLVYKNRENNISQFTLRTLTEMGFQRCQILFSTTLNKDEIFTFKLISMLSDYGFMARNKPEHIKTFDKLLSENGNLFTEKQLQLLLDFISSAKSNNMETHSLLTKKTRMLADSIQNKLYKKTPILSIFKPSVIKILFASFSHIVHGNVLLLIDILSNKRNNQLKLRVYWVLLLTGINMVNHISAYLDKSEVKAQVEILNKDFIVVASHVNSYWKSI